MASRIATIALGAVAVLLGIVFEKQNVAFMVGLAFCVAASANFPILLLSMYWRKITTRGAVVGGALGLMTALVLVLLGPTVWVDTLGFKEAIFPYKYPAIFSISVAFVAIWLISVLDKSASAQLEAACFDEQFVRAQTGINAAKVAPH